MISADPKCHHCNKLMSGPVISLSKNRGGDRWPTELEFCSFKCLKTWTNSEASKVAGWT